MDSIYIASIGGFITGYWRIFGNKLFILLILTGLTAFSKSELSDGGTLGNRCANYANQLELNIGMMDIVCRHCQASLYPDELEGMCCNGRKVKLYSH